MKFSRCKDVTIKRMFENKLLRGIFGNRGGGGWRVKKITQYSLTHSLI
jgi:hypothetical protein